MATSPSLQSFKFLAIHDQDIRKWNIARTTNYTELKMVQNCDIWSVLLFSLKINDTNFLYRYGRIFKYALNVNVSYEISY
jgi:hypothetical protein